MANGYRFIHARRKGSKKNKHGKNGFRGGHQLTSSERLSASRGQFPFTEINGFKLKEVQWTVPDKKTRESRRRSFDKVRERFLMMVGQTMEQSLRDMGMNDKQIAQVKRGRSPVGYNVHHKLPIHGGGLNEFSNLILMPIGPHDELHHKVMDPQVAQMQSGDSKKVVIPWTDDMVYVDPSRKNDQPQQSAFFTHVMAARRKTR